MPFKCGKRGAGYTDQQLAEISSAIALEVFADMLMFGDLPCPMTDVVVLAVTIHLLMEDTEGS